MPKKYYTFSVSQHLKKSISHGAVFRFGVKQIGQFDPVGCGGGKKVQVAGSDIICGQTRQAVQEPCVDEKKGCVEVRECRCP